MEIIEYNVFPAQTNYESDRLAVLSRKNVNKVKSLICGNKILAITLAHQDQGGITIDGI